MAETTTRTTTKGKVRFDLSGLSQGFPNSFPQHLSFHFSPLSLAVLRLKALFHFREVQRKKLAHLSIFLQSYLHLGIVLQRIACCNLRPNPPWCEFVSRQMRTLNPCSKKEALECVPIKVRLCLFGFKCILKALPPPPISRSPRRLVNRRE